MDHAIAIDKARQGFDAIPLSQAQKDQALTFLEEWLTQPQFADYLPQLEYLIEQENWSLLLDSFYQIIPFGTGGRRGAVGVGPNRINPYTLATSVQGHVEYIKQTFPNQKEYSVVIAYDVRLFKDIRKRYDPKRPNPLMGLTSKDFAQMAAGIYAANGIHSYILKPESQTYLSTPELSFLIRYYKTQGGLNISASHNHPDDNGGKFYNAQGGQPIPPHDQEMSTLVEKVQKIEQITFEEAIDKGFIHWITPEDRQQYLQSHLANQDPHLPKNLTIAFTPMNGTGSTNVGQLLEKMGYTVKILPSQADFDGSFKNVRYNTPNPEVVEAMSDITDFAKELQADLALATDPDADRIGLVAPYPNGEWRFFNGNEIASLVSFYLLQSRQRHNTLPKNPILVKTEVTSNLLKRIVEQFGGTCVGDLLVGFKYIGNALDQWEQHGEFAGIKASLDDFILGVEESHGFLTSTQLRDKDAAGAALALAELASLYKQQGKTLTEVLEEIHRQFGYFRNALTAMIMEGAIGISRIKAMQASLRENPPKEIAGRPVLQFFDHWNEKGRFGPFKSQTDRQSRNVLVFHLENDIRLILRPSGTEPKAKLYVEVPTPPLKPEDNYEEIKRKTDELALSISEAFTAEALKRIDIDLPHYILKTSDLVSIDKKILLAQTILPEWEKHILNNAPLDHLNDWLNETLLAIHPQPKKLIERAIRQFIEEKSFTPQQKTNFLRSLELLP